MVIGIDICNAAAAWRNIVEPAFVERFEKNQDSAGGADLLHVGQQVAAGNLAGGDDVLHLRRPAE